MGRSVQNRCGIACSLTPDGGGSSHTTTATDTQIPRFFMSAPHLNGFSAGAGADAEAADTTAVDALTQSRCARRDCLRDSDACDTLCTRDGLPIPRLMDGAAAGRGAIGHDATWRARACVHTYGVHQLTVYTPGNAPCCCAPLLKKDQASACTAQRAWTPRQNPRIEDYGKYLHVATLVVTLGFNLGDEPVSLRWVVCKLQHG